MTDKLPPDYLDYSQRRYGQDHDRYDWSYTDGAKAANDGTRASLAIIIPIERFILNPEGSPFRAPGAMVTPYPDLRHFTTRDYGNRIGVFRLLKVLRDLGLKATFPISAKLLVDIAPLTERILADGHEIAALGLDMDCLHWGGLDPEREATYVEQARACFTRADLNPKTWMSPARQQSPKTLDMIAENGFSVCLDWEFDSTPRPMRTNTSPVVMVPNLNELDDRKILVEKRHSEAEWAEQLIEASAYSSAIATAEAPQGFAFTLTPYLSGLPYRIKTVGKTLNQLKTIANFMTVSELANSAT